MTSFMLQLYAEVLRDIEKKADKILKEYGTREPGAMRKYHSEE